MSELVFLEPNRIDAEPFTTSEVIEPPNQQVYVIERGKNDVKIGVSTRFSIRMRTIETQGGFNAARHFAGKKISNGYAVEKLVHSKFSGHRGIGEWFNISFEDAVSAVISVTEEIGETVDKQRKKIPEFWNNLPSAMEDLEELDPILYCWCIKNDYEVRYTERGLLVYGDFGEGFREEMDFHLFRAITYAILNGVAMEKAVPAGISCV